jgi:hypothetical protein
MTLFTPERQPAARERARKEYADDLAHFTAAPLPVAALRESLALCREAGISSALLRMPEGPAFRSWYGPHARGEIDRILDSIRESHKAAVIDASEWLDAETFFIDSHHLTPDGAAVFSHQLADRALIPLLKP